MIEPRPRPLSQPPTVAPPPLFRERRTAHRRAEDRQAHQEKVLLARALDVLAAESSAEERLAGILRLLAATVGAERAAVLADGAERRVAVAILPGEDPTAAEALAGWLDAAAGRSRAERAAAGRAPISIVVAASSSGATARPFTRSEPATRPIRLVKPERPSDDEPERDGRPVGARPSLVGELDGRRYALLPIPSAGPVFLGFEFARRDAPDGLAERLPPQLARHAAVVLSLVTAQVAADRELASLRAQEAERAQFVSTVAHELRTPLTGLRGYLELILADQVEDPAVQREFLERSRGIVGSMGDLVGDLLELSRLESGTIALESAPFSLAEAAGAVAAGLHPIALERGTSLATSLPPRMRSATGDRRRVEQILTNLAANALKFAPAGGSVEISAWFAGPVAIVAVRDDGPGIDDDDRPLIFERFHRLAGHERITGTGLGLPIARDLARRMGGELDLASVPGAGSTFILVLPGPTAVDGEALTAAMEAALAAETAGLGQRAILRREPESAHGSPADREDHPAVRRTLRQAIAMPAANAEGRLAGSSRLRALRTTRSVDPTPA